MKEPANRQHHRKCPLLWARLVIYLVMASCALDVSDSLRFTSIQMPALVQRGTNFWLSCQYELVGLARAAHEEHASDMDANAPVQDEQLYSVKWYKNNEEFYRLIFAPGSANQQTQPTGELQVGGGAPQAANSGQQQYFAQPGVNVLMSSSNATHVRLLNASLESDGSYACEISTQNLSTIRYEKEIKVYVLPNSKLNLIGLKGLYALGDRVELNCLSDFSRPAGALGWFINGRRLITTARGAPFLVGPQLTKPKAGESKLVRSSLALKFRLTSEMLAAVAAASSNSRQTLDLFERLANNESQPTSATTISNKRNQSKSLLASFSDQQTDAARLGAAGTRLLELLRLECRYKLTEVSDVTFAELKISGERPAPTSGVVNNSSAASLRRSRLGRRTVKPSVAGQRRRPDLAATASASGEQNNRRARLTKSLANQVQQWSCPARRDELLSLLSAANGRGACRLGLLALHREDPVIVEADEVPSEETEEGAGVEEEAAAAEVATAGHASGGGPLQLPIGAIIGVNCSTLGALSVPRPVVSRSLHSSVGDANDDQRAAEASNDQSVIYCGDIEARKRLLISGKYQQAPAEQHWSVRAHKGSAAQQNRRHLAAYISFEAPATMGQNSSVANNNGRRQQAVPRSGGDTDNKLSLSNLNGIADSSNLAQLEAAAPKSLADDYSQAERANGGGGSGAQQPAAAWLAPPLLEWFINNQEAPKSSASYWPELPLTFATRPQQVAQHGNHAPSSRPDEPEEDPAQLPSIDYREYFANFDARTHDQHLMLRLPLEKRHFMTADSILKLRCTSTQAQVLAVEFLHVSLYALPPGVKPTDDDQLNQELQMREQGPSSSRWNHGQPSSQIKPKYLHRRPPTRPSNDHKGGLADDQYRNQYRAQNTRLESNRASAAFPSAHCPICWLLLTVLTSLIIVAETFNTLLNLRAKQICNRH